MDYQDFIEAYGPNEPAIPVGKCQVVAQYSWSGEQKTDLGFVEGDLVDVASTGDGDWWVGRLKRNKVTGSFPRNFVKFVDPHQLVRRLDTDVSALAVSQPLTSSQTTQQSFANSGNSKRSVQSTEQILLDISNELKDLTSSFNSLDTNAPAIAHLSFESFDEGSDGDDAPPPAPPPHKFLPSSSGNSAKSQPPVVDQFSLDQHLMRKITDSPDFDEIPFDPRSFGPQTVTLQPPTDRARSNERVFSGLSTRSRSVEYLSHPGPNVAPSPPKKSSSTHRFVKKLFNKRENSQEFGLALTRTTSASSRLSTISSASRIKRSLLSPLKSWAKNLRDPDNEFYPSNHHQGTFEAPAPVTTAKTTTSKASLDPSWMDNQRNLYRSKTLTEHEMQKRRQTNELRGVASTSPLDLVQNSSNEFHDYRLENFEPVDHEIMSLSSWPKLMTPAVFASSHVGRRFSDPVERLRAVFILCAFHITALKDVDGPDLTDMQGTLSRAMHTKMATPLELAHLIDSMCSALDIESRVIRGYLRTTDSEASGKPHSWNAVKIEGEWRLLDASAASPSSPHATIDDINTSYFLCPPQQMIFTHIPSQLNDQFLTPAIPVSAAVTLPLAGPSAFMHGVELVDFSPSLLHLQNFDMCELKISMPNDRYDVVVVCKSKGDEREGAALAQPIWEGGRRMFRIKACLPEGSSKGSLQLYLADRTVSSSSVESMSLIYSLTLYHQGSNAEFEFVRRFAAPQAQRNDVYIAAPQCRQLGKGQPYTFEFHQHPSKGITPGCGLMQVKLAVQSPSGRITDLTPRSTGPSDTWKATVRVLEVGTWRAVVSSDDGQGWAALGEWFCS